MEVKLNLSNTEHKELLAYCNLNDLLISEVVKKSFTTGFNIERYGLLNAGIEEKQVVKEVIVEKRVEIPVEVIKEVVKVEYVEVPVEKIVQVTKEVPVEKIVEIIREVPVEKIIEVIKEVPVERVVEKIVEVTKEVPVEKVVIQEVIKEVPVEKVVYVTDHEEMKSKIFQKEQEFEEQRKIFSTKTTEMENIFQNSLAKKDEDLDELRRTLDELLDKPPVEKIVEVIKEVTVEKIVEVVKEVPVEVVKEIVIEKEGDSNLKPKMDALQNTVQKLKLDNIEKDKLIKEYEKTIEDIQKFQNETKAMYLKGSNLDDKLYK
jgi:hypothetical protein